MFFYIWSFLPGSMRTKWAIVILLIIAFLTLLFVVVFPWVSAQISMSNIVYSG